jgi:hypothetical protein
VSKRWGALLLLALACGRERPLWTPSFDCAGGACVQRHPRLPDDGEWECVDMVGASVCKGGDAPAGVVPGPPDQRWTCGARGGERVCVDLAADFPGGDREGWRCRYENAPRPRRLCLRDPAAHHLGDPCEPRRPCVDGATCRDGRCVAPPPHPSCWLDADCGSGACRFGTCRVDR